MKPLIMPSSMDDLIAALNGPTQTEKFMALRVRRVLLRCASEIVGGYTAGSPEDKAADLLIKMATRVGL